MHTRKCGQLPISTDRKSEGISTRRTAAIGRVEPLADTATAHGLVAARWRRTRVAAMEQPISDAIWCPKKSGKRSSSEDQNFHTIPIVNKPGLPPAALKRSYSPRNATDPMLNCAPAPAARPVVVRLSVGGSAINVGQGWLPHTVCVVALLSMRAMPAFMKISTMGMGRYTTPNADSPFIDTSVAKFPFNRSGCPKSS